MLNLELDQKKGDQRTVLLTLLVPTLLVFGLLVLLVALREGVEAAVADLSNILPVSYAFAAGMVASVNPCGVLMLPTYVLYHLGATTQQAPRHLVQRLLGAVRLALVVTAGFTVIFMLVGGAIAAGGQWLVTIFPYAGLLIGASMIGLGLWLLLSHRTLGIAAAGRIHIDPQHNIGNMFLFGVVYAVGSLSCTLPIFLVVVGSALAGGDLGNSLGQFLGYALGMGAVILAVTIGTALFRRAISRWLNRLTPYVHRVSALFLVGAGGYLIYYWVFLAGLF